jgi:tetratricopeptide (TPR) repeat protein
MSPRLLLCGWDAADWRIVHELLDKGEMPNLARCVSTGSMGTLQAGTPLVPPILWTTLATGKHPDVHRILSGTESDPLTGHLIPPARTSRATLAIWDILAGHGLRTHVIGWPVTHPAHTTSGVVVSDRFACSLARPDEAWPILPNAVTPPDAESALTELRLQPGDLDGDDLLPFVPRLTEIDQGADRRLVPLAVALAETVTIHAAATWAIENRAWDFTAVRYPLLGDVSRHYMRYDGASEIYGAVVRAAYRLQDAMLGSLQDLCGPDTHIMVVSAHGFVTGDQRPVAGSPTAAGDFWPRTHGIFCVAGADIRADELVHGANSVDVAPTILALFGLPKAEDMPGRVLAEALAFAPPAHRVATYETDPELDDEPDPGEMLRFLSELGYSDPIADKLRAASDRQQAGKEFALACVHLGAGRIWEAAPVLERVVAEDPDNEFAQLYLAAAYLLARRWGDCSEKLDNLTFSAAHEEFAAVIRGRLLLAQGRTLEAIAYVREIEARTTAGPLLGCLLGDAYRASRLPTDAERCYRNVVEKHPEVAIAHAGLAGALLAQRRNEEAVGAALDATGLDFGLPHAHYILGVALTRTSRLSEAVRALERCVQLAPDNTAAIKLLRRLRSKCA